MFRKKASKPPRTVLRTQQHDDEASDDDGGVAIPVILPQKRTVGLSFGGTDEGGIRPTQRRRRLGYGGGGAPLNVDDDEPTSKPHSAYNAESLKQLRQQQQVSKKEPPPQPASEIVDDLLGQEDFVPLRVVTGDEAMHYSEPITTTGATDDAGPKQQQVAAELDDEDDPEWQAQVARRAGIVSAPRPSTITTAATTAQSPASANLSMEELRKQVEDSIQQLRTKQQEFKQTLARRGAEVAQTRQEAQRQAQDVQEHGTAVEYYQHLQQRLVTWVGAARQLQEKVIPLQQALHQVEAELAAADRWKEWENDMIAVLYQYDRLDQVLGKQPDPVLYDPVSSLGTLVDEFGRDVKSQATVQREQRARRRQKIRQQRETWRGDESDGNVSDEEKENLRERHNALQQALQLAMNELDSEYTVLQNVVDVFAEWRHHYPHDYKQCYASLSLADLATVLIQAELCSLNDPWNESEGYNESKWMTVLHGADESGVLDKAGVERVLEKAVDPAVSGLLSCSGYNVVSTRQSRCLSQFVKNVVRLAPESPAANKLRSKLADYMTSYLLELSIPIVSKGGTVAENDPEELKEAMEGATIGQMYRLEKVLCNIILQWSAVLSEETSFVETVLDFAASKFLFLISLLQHHVSQPNFAESPMDAYRKVCNALKPTGWLEDPRWMLQAAPIRAAVAVYTS